MRWLTSIPRATAAKSATRRRWQRHHRLVAEFAAIARGVEVNHLMHDGRLEAHRPTPGVRLRDDGLLVYDAGQDQLL